MGYRVAVVGATGSGKTTLGYLLARLYDVDAGSVRIDGHDVRDVTARSLSDALGVVTQETFLLHASIAENLRFARPDATDADLEEAARTAQVHDVIAALPQGYDTPISQAGNRLSGGQVQRIGLARALYPDPVLFVLDEPNSNLDNQGSEALNRAIRAIKARGGGVIIMAFSSDAEDVAGPCPAAWVGITGLSFVKPGNNSCDPERPDPSRPARPVLPRRSALCFSVVIQ